MNFLDKLYYHLYSYNSRYTNSLSKGYFCKQFRFTTKQVNERFTLSLNIMHPNSFQNYQFCITEFC